MLNSLNFVGSDLRHAFRTLRGAPLFTAVAVLSMGSASAPTPPSSPWSIRSSWAAAVERPKSSCRSARPRPRRSAAASATAPSSPTPCIATCEIATPSSRACSAGCDGDARLLQRPHRAGRGPAGVGHILPDAWRAAGDRTSVLAGDERTIGGHPVAVLGHAYWQSRFNGDPAIIGRTIVVNRHPLEIVGVAGALRRPRPRRAGEVYVPIVDAAADGAGWLQLEGRRFRCVQVFGRLRDGVTAAQARRACSRSIARCSRRKRRTRHLRPRQPTRNGGSSRAGCAWTMRRAATRACGAR